MADPSTYRPAPGSIPTSAGRLPVPRRAPAAWSTSARPRTCAPGCRRTSRTSATCTRAPPTMVTTAAERRVDGGQHRGRGAAAGVLLDQGVRPALQREVPRRQVLPVARGHPRRGVPAGDGRPRRQEARASATSAPTRHAWAIRETVDLLLRVFPMRSCSNGVFKRSGADRPALPARLHRQVLGALRRPGHRRGAPRRSSTTSATSWAARPTAFVKRIEKEMYAASAGQDYERAARLRDDLGALNRALEKQRGGARRRHRRRRDRAAPRTRSRSRCRSSTSAAAGSAASAAGSPTRSRTPTPAGWSSDFLLQLYDGEVGDSIPREVLVPALPDGRRRRSSSWLGEPAGRPGRRSGCRSAATRRRCRRPSPATPLQALALHKTKRASDLTTRNRALEEIQEALELPTAPLRIECYDISNLQGTEVVASMVVFEDGLARKSEYRRFVIRGVDGPERRRLDARGDHPPVPAAARRAGRVRRVRRTSPDDGRDGPDADRPGHRAAAEVRLRPGPGGRRRRPAAGRGRPAGARRARHRRHPGRAAWPSGSRRSGCPARRTR